MTANNKYKLVASALVLGAVLVASGIWGTFSSAMQPPENAKHTLGLSEWVYLKNDQGKKYIGSYLGTYVVSTGGCNRMTSDDAIHWNCNRWTVQNGWGVLYKKVEAPANNQSFVVSDAHALIPRTNGADYNTFYDAKIIETKHGEGHIWDTNIIERTGQIGVDLVLYDLSARVGHVFP